MLDTRCIDYKCMDVFKNHLIDLCILWVFPKYNITIDLLHLARIVGRSVRQGYITFKFKDFTIKLSKRGILNIYLKKFVIQKLKRVNDDIIKTFYRMVSEYTNIRFVRFLNYNIKIVNVHGHFEHSIVLTSVYRCIFEDKGDLRIVSQKDDNNHFKISCKYGTQSIQTNCGTFIATNLELYTKLFHKLEKYYQENITNERIQMR